MTIKLRGHHLLCLLGYRGKGYSADFCVNMTQVYEKLRQEPQTKIELIVGPDDICAAFPTDQVSHCRNDSVYRKDEEIAELIGIAVGEAWPWAAICEAVAARVQPGDVASICRDCQWEPYGMCREGVAHIHNKPHLRKLPEA
ncbi:DUF1284 domain-containing protein [Paenibacillus herberti]|uniref:DUF1284 domain-containing protein n=1 Tax=Paenibacillus herberti TaxID=1619309 RepID=A0A229NW11_9BACL|nr:DUF1284 domain-containing protein [Paenibacillus herberti]OXM13915.1 hypothetical protein CGZ75_12950 [Paenibacillus herberti]